ncbi:hypothetical protein TNCV_3845941 [Trichonephila clavipes]|nr:hypothetical protein TNCV_3845941 [Trichonephila clavipes]
MLRFALEKLKKAPGNNSSTRRFLPVSRLEMKLKGHHFVDSDEVIQNATRQMKDLSKNGFQKCSNSYTNAGTSVWTQKRSYRSVSRINDTGPPSYRGPYYILAKIS